MDKSQSPTVAEMFRVPSSLLSWDAIETPNRLSIVSMSVDHHTSGSWYMRSLHQKYSLGWNRTVERGFLVRPFACSIRFIGVALESTLKGFVDGGTGTCSWLVPAHQPMRSLLLVVYVGCVFRALVIYFIGGENHKFIYRICITYTL